MYGLVFTVGFLFLFSLKKKWEGIHVIASLQTVRDEETTHPFPWEHNFEDFKPANFGDRVLSHKKWACPFYFGEKKKPNFGDQVPRIGYTKQPIFANCQMEITFFLTRPLNAKLRHPHSKENTPTSRVLMPMPMPMHIS